MSVQRLRKVLKLDEALELLNSSDSDEIDFEIAVLPLDANEIYDEDEWDENARCRRPLHYPGEKRDDTKSFAKRDILFTLVDNGTVNQHA
ncbi:hypothetical protein TNCV_640171 [Trichonephila clavipes]|nr:hypothetical protein TNCV_640171 [Trichonephila clavipes]